MTRLFFLTPDLTSESVLAKVGGQALLLPAERPVPEHLGQPQPLWLPPIEDRLDDIWRQAGEREETADVGVCDALLLRKVGDRPGLTALDLSPPAMRAPLGEAQI